ncbi:MAG TPA: discoidin domain-containing protein [Verrucomicrobiae bacterium]
MRIISCLRILWLAVLFDCAASVLAADGGGDSSQNIALNCAAYQSGSADDDHTADLVTDGSTETYWESKLGQTAWLEMDFGEACPFTRVVLKWGQSYATAFRLEVSNDGLHPQTWAEIYATTNGVGGVQGISIPPTTARHLRIVTTAVSDSGQGCIISEVEVYGQRKLLFTPALQPAPAAYGSLELTGGNWKLCNTMFVQATPEQMGQANYDDSRWLPAEVPGTVLGSYLAIGAIPDPWYGDQMSEISEDFFTRHDFWYRDNFLAPASDAGKRVWLNFSGINWKADIYLNGTQVGHIDGAYIRGRFDVTKVIRPGETNYLVVLIHKVADSGSDTFAVLHKVKILHKKLNTPTSNGALLGYDSPTFLASSGWNWIPIVRGRDVGIWNNVRLQTSGDVTIQDPWVTTDLPLPDVSHADLTVRAELQNHSSVPQTGKLIGTIGNVTFEQTETLAPNETNEVVLNKTNCPALAFNHPRLWWPNGYGQQPLYQLKLRFEQDSQVSDEKSANFGIRKLECRVINKVLTVFVNGTRILCRGGNWGMAEGMLNLDDAGMDLRVRLHHDANLVMIRNWVGMEGHDSFYDACDRYGILIWDDFWIANPADGPEPADHTMFMANARDKILRVRSHPSLALYCGRNEGNPPPDLDAGMRAAVASLDGTRTYIPHSASGTVTGFGPYSVQDVDWYFAHRGRTLHSELGIVAVPPVESMRAMMPPEDLWPINDMWAVHDYQTEGGNHGRSPLYTQRIEKRYGDVSGIEDYCRKAQMVNLETAKAMFESLQANQGSGILVWMTQAAWPSLICQLYDHYFEMTGAYFGAKSGCEPIHILWDSDTDVIMAANNTPSECNGLTAEAGIYNFAGQEIWHKSVKLDLTPTSVKDCFPITRPTDSSPVFFVKLTLKHGKKIISDNFYWSSAKGASCKALNDLPPVKLAAQATQSHSNELHKLSVRITNPTRNVALAIRLKVQRANSGERVLPVFYSDNYFSLLPGESKIVSVEFADKNLAGEMPKLIAEGWNIPSQEIALGDSDH